MIPVPLRAYAVLWAAFYAGLGLMGVYAPLWLQSRGLTPASIGLVLAVPGLARLVAPYAWGWWGDHSGRRVDLLKAATALALLGTAALLLPLGAVGLGLAVLLQALGQQGVVPLGEAAQQRQMLHADGSIDTHAYGRVRLWGSVGFMAAVAAGGWVLDGERIAWFPWLCLLGFAATAWVPWRLPARAEPAAAVAAGAPAGVLAVLRRPTVAWFFASIMAMVLAHMALNVGLSLYLEALGYRRGVIGLFWVVGVVVEVAFFAWQGRFFGRITAHGWLMLTALVAALRFALTGQAGELTGAVPGAAAASSLALGTLLVLCQASHALTFGAHHTACTTLIARHFPDRLRGRGGALYASLGYGVPAVLGGSAGGWLAEHQGYPALFQAATLAALLSLACAWQSRRAEGRS